MLRTNEMNSCTDDGELHGVNGELNSGTLDIRIRNRECLIPKPRTYLQM